MRRASLAVDAKALAMADLGRSGLDERDFKRLKLRVVDAETMAERAKLRVPALELPYLGVDGRPTGFARYRLLEYASSFGAAKPIRYWQPKGSPVRAYFPALTDWEIALNDPARPLWLTEGEKKAAAACKAGVDCIGLGGVWNWRSNRDGLVLIEDLAGIFWAQRTVVLAFDAEGSENPLVKGALAALTLELHRRGAEVHIALLPLLAGAEKTGLDDYLVAGNSIERLPVEPSAIAARVAELNYELAFIRQPAGVYHLATGQLFATRGALADMYANRLVEKTTAAGKVQLVPLLDEWLRWPYRREHASLAYEPGEAKITTEGAYNLWVGWPYQPIEGDVSLFEDLLDFIFGAEADGVTARAWFLKWAAYPLQRPGAKLYTSVLVHSIEHGSGKSLLGYTLANLYGKNASVITQEELHSAFNDWQHEKQFIVGEEVTGSDKRQDMDRLKHAVTGEKVRINRKFQPAYEVRNCANFFFTSNQPDALSLEDGDRRQFVWEVRGGRLPTEFAQAYDHWFRSPEGRQALFYHLLHLDRAGFESKEPAPMTTAKRRMIALSGNDADRLARDLLEDPARFLCSEGELARELYALDDLLVRLEARGYDVPSRVVFARALRRHGAIDLPQTKTAAGTIRPWALKEKERWLQADHTARATALAPLTKPKKY